MGRTPKPSPNERAQWVRDVRTKIAHQTQAQFAAAIDSHEKTISRWETGYYVPEWDSIEKILKAFPSAPRPPFAPDNGMSDPDRSLVPAGTSQGTNVELTDGAIVARDVDSEPKQFRARLRNAALLAIQEEKKRIAEEARRNPTEPDADEEARPRPGRSSSGRATRT